jgi:hypothetical protein
MSFSPDNEILVEEVPKPTSAPVLDVIQPKRKREIDLEQVLNKASKEVFAYFGREFIYQQYNNLFPAAIGVEIRLQGIDYSAGTYDILYKSHKVSDYSFDFVFMDAVANVITFRKEEGFAEEKDEFKSYVKLFGLKQGYLIGIPEKEEGKVKVEKI